MLFQLRRRLREVYHDPDACELKCCDVMEDRPTYTSLNGNPDTVLFGQLWLHVHMTFLREPNQKPMSKLMLLKKKKMNCSFIMERDVLATQSRTFLLGGQLPLG